MTSNPHRQAQLSRADLLWAFSTIDPSRREEMAELLEFEKKTEKPKKDEKKWEPVTGYLDSYYNLHAEDKNKPEKDVIVPENTSYYRIIERKREKKEDITDQGKENTLLPVWYQKAKPNYFEQTESAIPEIHSTPPKYQPLVCWSRLWPFLYRVLGTTTTGMKPDVPKLVDRVANGEPIRKIPRLQHRNWAETAQILIDINRDNFPYRNDYFQLCDQLEKLRGVEGLDIQYLDDEPGGDVIRYQNGQEQISRWRMPGAETPLLILSDLGMQAKSRRALYNWLVFGQQLAVLGCRPTVLMPVAERDLDKRLVDYFDCVVWDGGSRLKPLSKENKEEKNPEKHRQALEILLSCFFPAVRVDAGLLRAVRKMLPADRYDVGHEAAIWHHTSVHAVNDQWGWQSASRINYRQKFIDWIGGMPRNKQQKLIDLIGRFHTLLPDELYFESILELMTLEEGLPIPEQVKQATERFIANLVKTYGKNDWHTGLDLWVKRYLSRHDDAALRKNNQYYIPLLAFDRIRQNGNGENNWPEDIPIETILCFINERRKEKRFLLRQVGEKLQLIAEDRMQSENGDWGSAGTTLVVLPMTDTQIVYCNNQQEGESGNKTLNLKNREPFEFKFSPGSKYTFQIGGEHFTVEASARMEHLDWAVARGMSSEYGAYVETQSVEGDIYRWYWHPPEWNSEEGMLRGFWYSEPQQSFGTPEWSERSGRDRFGLYADMKVKGIRQRMRWIEPGRFEMGSPENEPERYGDEILHTVTLSQGFWLADTAVTQALWEAVEKKNPSRFEGENRPVEMVSWDDAQRFIEAVNRLKPELKLRLPTEAQWEYACRAGTTTPFSFGENITPEQVNYNGTAPYHNGIEGLYRKETVAVKTLPGNDWGLYEMHGNVWEWCRDWFGEYDTTHANDPAGPDQGGHRVLRGGSWIHLGRYVRSACRHGRSPVSRDDYFGFRLSRGHSCKPVRQAGSKSSAGPDSRVAEQRRSGPVDGLRKLFGLDK